MRVRNSQSAFTLIEVMITLAILVMLVYAVSQMMRSGFDMRRILSERSGVTHRVNVAMETLAQDLAGAFIISNKDTTRDGNKKRTLFKIEKSDSDTLSFTFIGHQAVRKDAKESDVSFVKYEVRASKSDSGRKHLYRGVTPRVPESFNTDIPMSVLAEDIASVSVESWNGDSFSKDGWDSSQSDSQNMIPHMVRVTIYTWDESPEDRSGKDVKPTVYYSTVISLPYAFEFKEKKQRVTSFSLYKS